MVYMTKRREYTARLTALLISTKDMMSRAAATAASVQPTRRITELTESTTAVWVTTCSTPAAISRLRARATMLSPTAHAGRTLMSNSAP